MVDYFAWYKRMYDGVFFYREPKDLDYDKMEKFFKNVLLMSDEEFDKFWQERKLKAMVKTFYNGEKDPQYSESTWQDNLVAKDSNDQSMKR